MSFKISYEDFIKTYVGWTQEVEFSCRGVNYFVGSLNDIAYIDSYGPNRPWKATEYKTRKELVEDYKIDGQTIKEIFNEIEIIGIH